MSHSVVSTVGTSVGRRVSPRHVAHRTCKAMCSKRNCSAMPGPTKGMSHF